MGTAVFGIMLGSIVGSLLVMVIAYCNY